MYVSVTYGHLPSRRANKRANTYRPTFLFVVRQNKKPIIDTLQLPNISPFVYNNRKSQLIAVTVELRVCSDNVYLVYRYSINVIEL